MGEFGAGERAEAALAEFNFDTPAGGRGGGGGGRVADGGRQNTLREIVTTATGGVAAGDQHAAVEEKFLQGAVGEGDGAPAALAANCVGKGFGVERATLGEGGQEMRGEFTLGGVERAGLGAGAAGARGHGGAQVGPGGHFEHDEQVVGGQVVLDGGA